MLYRISFQMDIKCDLSPTFIWSQLKPYLRPRMGVELDEWSSNEFRVKFHSDMMPSEIKKNLSGALPLFPGILYADVLYRFPDEIFHDRFVVWNDGTAQEYTTKDVYIEDGERTEVKA